MICHNDIDTESTLCYAVTRSRTLQEINKRLQFTLKWLPEPKIWKEERVNGKQPFIESRFK